MSLIQLSNGQILSMPGQLDDHLANAKPKPKAKLMVSVDALINEILDIRQEWYAASFKDKAIDPDGNSGNITVNKMCDEFFEIISRVSGYSIEDLNTHL